MEFVFSPELLVAFATLLVLEIILGIDNVIFISILASKLPPEQQAHEIRENKRQLEALLGYSLLDLHPVTL